MSTDEIIVKLINLTIDQAEQFLKDAREFYPFATVFTYDERYKPLSVALEVEKPSANLVLEELEKGLKARFSVGFYKAVAIGVNVSLARGDKIFQQLNKICSDQSVS